MKEKLLYGFFFGVHIMLCASGLLISSALGFDSTGQLFTNGIGFFTGGFTLSLCCMVLKRDAILGDKE